MQLGGIYFQEDQRSPEKNNQKTFATSANSSALAVRPTFGECLYLQEQSPELKGHFFPPQN